MKKIVFLVHDPGGYDVVYPVVRSLAKKGIPVEFYCMGPAAALNADCAVTVEQVISKINSLILNNGLLGLVTGTSWGKNLELMAISACKEANIPTVSILDYWSNYCNRFKDDAGQFIYPDYYIVMDELAKEEAAQVGVPISIIRPLGHPGLDCYVAYKARTKGCNKAKRKILFLSQPLSQLYGQQLGYTEKEVIEDCLCAVQAKKGYSLHIKFHPKDDVMLQKDYADIAVQGNLIDIMPDYDLIIGMSTMGLLHAVLMGIPAVSYQPGLKQADKCITNKLGLSKLITSYQELLLFLESGNEESIIVTEELSQKFIWLDGRSTERVTGFIREVLLSEN